MSVKIIEEIKATWTCDWCFKTEITKSKSLPDGWDACSIEPSGGEHYCSVEHYQLARNAWEDGFEAGLTAQSEHREKLRLEWMATQLA